MNNQTEFPYLNGSHWYQANPNPVLVAFGQILVVLATGLLNQYLSARLCYRRFNGLFD